VGTSKAITDRHVLDAFSFAGGGGTDSRGWLDTYSDGVQGAPRRPLRASGNDVAPGLHRSSQQGGLRSTDGDPFAQVAGTPDAQHEASLRAGALRFRWSGSYPDFSGIGGYRRLYLLSDQRSTNTATLMGLGEIEDDRDNRSAIDTFPARHALPR